MLTLSSATMVTATLPSLTDESEDEGSDRSSRKNQRASRQSMAFSIESELTITPERYTRTISSDRESSADQDHLRSHSKASALAGYVGLATGCGALVALVLFLPMPTRFGNIDNVTQAEAVSYSFYVVGAIALAVAVFVFFGLRDLKGEDGKGWSVLLGLRSKYEEDGETVVQGQDASQREVGRRTITDG